MNCCVNCFESDYIRSIISSHKNTGTCDYCNSENVFICEVSHLGKFFKGILDLYEVDPEYENRIASRIMDDFSPSKSFNTKKLSPEKLEQLIFDAVQNDIVDYQELNGNCVLLKSHIYNNSNAIVDLLSTSWEDFSEEIKTVNRFHFQNPLDLKKIKILLGFLKNDIPKGKNFYRARVSNERGFSVSEMGTPPAHLAKNGRANPEGISYLYLAKYLETTLYEVRAGLHDYVSIGTFRPTEDIKIVNISRETYDVFRLAESEELEEALIQAPFIDRLGSELSKPVRRSDSKLEYLPTQYLCELIKSMGFDGIEFKSSLHREEFEEYDSQSKYTNIVVFCPDKFECTKVETHEITKTSLTYKKCV